jgi:hypothetical protein
MLLRILYIISSKKKLLSFPINATMDSFFLSNNACSTFKILYVAILEYSTHLRLSPLRKMFCIVVVHQKLGRGSLTRAAYTVKKRKAHLEGTGL